MAVVSDSNLLRLRRFLYLGDEYQSYPQSITYPFNPEAAECIRELLKSNLHEEAIAEIKNAYNNHHFLGFETVVYSLVVIGHAETALVRKLAMAAAQEICTTASTVLTFTHFYKEASKPSKGWGRGHRKFLINWYNGKEAKDLAVEVTKVKTRYKWSHKDVICMAHIKAKNTALSAVFKYIVKGLETAVRECAESYEAEPVISYLKSAYELGHAIDPVQAARLIEINDFCLEHIPPKIFKSKEVSLCMIPKLPLQTLLDVLPKFNKVGLLKPNSLHSTAVLERLAAEEMLADNSVDPLQTFVAVRKWQISNQTLPGKSVPRQVNPAIQDALHNLHLKSFSSLKSTDKRYLVALDMNVIMNLNKCAGCNAVTPSHISDILLMALVQSESSLVSVAFAKEEIEQVTIDDKMTLSDVVEQLSSVQPGPLVLSSPLNWALTKKMPFDTVIVFTHRLSSTEDGDLANVFKEYKATMHLPDAKFILCTLCDHTSTFPHESPHYLNIVGFNPKLLKVIQDFSCSVF